ncbi:MAG: hypothetical protein IH986_03650 [Planctomycetes bacterium]|nr:hypothetical protein [Planctomycetota bacterium]
MKAGWTGIFVLGLLSAAPLRAQWDPVGGQWGKSNADDLRIMTWNVEDGICSSNLKSEGVNNWTALARIVAAMQPDVLVLQETADNSGNGTGSGVDSVVDLETTFDLFFHGGQDPFRAGQPQVTAWVQKYVPDYDLPYVFVSLRNDGFNRNVILSRFPFGDLNGDGRDNYIDIPFVSPHRYAPGGNGGIRGFQLAEIDLPNLIYAGDLVIANAHLKAGGSSSDRAQRLTASQNTAYVIDFWYNGAGTGIPDPFNKIIDNPPATHILDDDTPVVLAGDWNEDELSNGRRGPAEWLASAQITGGSDGTDRDRSDSTLDNAFHIFTGSRATRGSSKLDYIAWQDSIASLRRYFVFDSAGTPRASLPPAVLGFGVPGSTSVIASDHLPVIVDLIVPTSGAVLQPLVPGVEARPKSIRRVSP